ncbi:MAG: alpha/beta hydrolase, partial [Solirubrobacteraceae bacterium]
PPARGRTAAVLVHGRDQDEQVMLDVVERLALPGVAFLLPVVAGRSWYPGRYFDPLAVNRTHLDQALAPCEAALVRLRGAGVEDERIVLGGFSQGACVVAELAARRPRPWAGVAVLTGALLGRPSERVVPADGVRGLDVLLGSSRHDEWVALADAQASARAFAAAGASVTVEVYDDRVHHVSDRAVAGLRRLLTAAPRRARPAAPD